VREGVVMNRCVCEEVVKCVRWGMWGWMEGAGLLLERESRLVPSI